MAEKLHLVIDTNEYRKDRHRSGVHFVGLKKLIELNAVQLHMPYVVKHEMISAIKEQFDESVFKNLRVRATYGTVDSYQKRSGLSELGDIRQTLETLRAQLEALKLNLYEKVEHEVDQWLRDMRAVEHDFGTLHANNVFRSYFRGVEPFQHGRNRSHIPDAFIIEVVKDLALNELNIAVVSGDRNLQAACRSLTNVTVFDSLATFLDEPSLRTLITHDEMLTNYFDEFRHEVYSLEGFLRKEVISSLDSVVTDQKYRSDAISAEDKKFSIAGIYDVNSFFIDPEGIEYFGNGVIVLPAHLDADIIANYLIYKPDFYTLSDELQDEISVSDWNDHYFSAEEEYRASIEVVS